LQKKSSPLDILELYKSQSLIEHGGWNFGVVRVLLHHVIKGGYLTSQADTPRRWQYAHERIAQCQRRLDEQEPAFKDRYRWRAGMEATMARLKHQMGLAHLRSRGMTAVKYTVFLRALGLNVLWVATCLRC